MKLFRGLRRGGQKQTPAKNDVRRSQDAPAASDLTGNGMTLLGEIDTIYTSPHRPMQDNHSPPKKQQLPAIVQRPPATPLALYPDPPTTAYEKLPVSQPPPAQTVQRKTTVNASGKRVTTTTIRVPPPPQPQPALEAPIVSSAGGAVAVTPASSTPGTPAAAAPAAAAAAPVSVPVPEDSTTEWTRELVKKFIADIWNRGELDLIPQVCSPSLRFNGNNGFDRVGHDGLARMVGTIREALDDYHCEIHSMVVEHNKAFCRLRFTGKHTGNLLGYEPTNRVVAWMGATEFTCQNGKILKVWELGDVKSLEEQISSDPTEGEQEELEEDDI